MKVSLANLSYSLCGVGCPNFGFLKATCNTIVNVQANLYVNYPYCVISRVRKYIVMQVNDRWGPASITVISKICYKEDKVFILFQGVSKTLCVRSNV